MYKILFLLLLIIPALEIGLLVLSGNVIGIIPTILLIILTGVIGVWLAKREGLQVIRLTQMQLAQGEIPSGVLLDGICILFGGILLLAPGFLTDLLGFYLLIPFTRGTVKALLTKIFQQMVQNGHIIFYTKR